MDFAKPEICSCGAILKNAREAMRHLRDVHPETDIGSLIGMLELDEDFNPIKSTENKK